MESDKLRSLVEDQLKLSRRLKARIAELEAERTAPLAVVGMAVRLPGGVRTPESYWDFLLGEDVALSDIPEDRPGLEAVYDVKPAPGRSYVRQAGFLDDISGFDASFFGISQREAEAMDPQQRLLLETAWEAFERAGIAVRREDRLPAGVFVGIMASEYGERLAGRADKSGIDPYFGTGGGHCFAAGRLSYVMGLSGPALSVDTACSSSLAALHLGAQSLRRGECRYALVGGANMILSADLMVSLCQSQALSADGRSKAFAASADGYGRGEGVGMLVLMRLDEAEIEGRPVLAVLRGTAVNHDGASSGLTVPSGPAQQEVVSAALADAGVLPADVGYVEAHGTGTALGDPIEIGALDAVLGGAMGPRPAPVAVGSVKSRIGHLEAAAGIAGVVKLVLMLRHGTIPAGLAESEGPLNPLMAWDKLDVVVPRRAQAWPPEFERRIAGISAFGLSGTNAHAVLESYVPKQSSSGAQRTELLTLSAKDPAALAELAASTAKTLRGLDAGELAAACHTLRTGRVHFGHRIAVTGSSAKKLADALTRPAEPVETGPAALRVCADENTVASLIEAVLEAFPALTSAVRPEPPAAQLEQIFRALGVRVRDAGAAAAGVPAELKVGSRRIELRDVPSLLEALALLYRGGAALRLEPLSAPGSSYLDSLSTYPFQRKRYWIDEPSAVTGTPSAPELRVVVPEESGNVRDFVFAELLDVLKAAELDPEVPFVEVGGDSFIGMLLAKSIEQRYGVEVPAEEFDVELPVGALVDQLVGSILRATGRDLGQERSA